jgi:integrase/recombinase XerD
MRYVQNYKNKIDNYSEQVFPTNTRFTVITSQIIKKLKRTNQKVKNVNQIRTPVITNWLKQYNLRKVQVLAGHRFISCTERYVEDDLENLQEVINNFHPIS